MEGAQLFPEKFIFMRHGIAAERPEFNGPDRERPLTQEGRLRTSEVARSLVAFSTPTLIVSSDLIRAVQTADIVLDAVKQKAGASPVHLQTAVLRPESCFDDWRDFVSIELQGILKRSDQVLVVGHQPTISSFFCRHLGVSQPFLAFKKAGVGIIQPITMEHGILVGYFPPKSWRE